MSKDNFKPTSTENTTIIESRVCPTCGIALSVDIDICPNDKTVLVKSLSLGGTLSDRYEIIEEIGAGGMGVIYKARLLTLNIPVAIKMLGINRMDRESIERFEHEAKAVSLLDHRGIVKLRDYGVTETGQPYMVLEYLDANTLEETIAWQGPCSVTAGVEIFLQIADALAHAHEKGILHRDLKPSNIMLIPVLNQAPLVKIVDFGIAKIVDPSLQHNPTFTKSGEIIGSPLYMSPEQSSGHNTDQRADVYSLGCIMYETLTGAPPFTGKNAIEIVSSHLNDNPPMLRDGNLRRTFPANVEATVQKALSKKPDDRFQSMNDLKEALLVIQSGSNRPIEIAYVPEGYNAARLGRAVFLGLTCALLVCAVIFAIWFGLTAQHKIDVPPKPPLVTTLKGSDARKYIAEHAGEKNIDLAGFLANDDDLQQFDSCTGTTSIGLAGSNVEGPGLAHLIHLPLTSLDLEQTNCNNRAIREITRMNRLEALTMTETKIDDDGLRMLGKNTTITALFIADDNLTDKALENMDLPNLKQLAFSKNVCSTAGLRKLATLPKLFWLDLDETQLSDQDTALFKDFKALTTLSLNRSKITAAGLLSLSQVPNLNQLHVSQCPGLNGLDFSIFRKFSQLGGVDVSRIMVKENTLSSLNKTKLLTLDLTGTNIDNRALDILADNRNLRKLTIRDCRNVTPEKVREFRKKRPDCTIGE